ncbi:MAG TPA: serine hydrolase domain-containing protein [Allosphingosinicella sp.]|jgi:CubicO group peptidase (beta-lactamase class C family)
MGKGFVAALSALCLMLAAQAEAKPGPARTGRDPAAAVARCVRERADAEGFSGIVSILRRGRPAAVVARGVAAGEGSRPIGSGTRFNLASASKMFTAVAVAQLVDSGKVRLDDPIGRFVEGLEPATAAVTVRQLLTHSSGLGSFFAPQNRAAMMRARTASDLLPLIADETPAFAPGSRFSYSNSGFALLGVMIERVSGRSYGDYLKAHVFAPAGMSSTGVDPAPLATLAIGMTSVSPGQGPAGAATRRPAPGAGARFGTPAGGLFGTAADIQKFLKALGSNRLASRAMTQALTTAQVQVAPPTATEGGRHYGFGFGAGTFEKLRWFGHNGGNPGANVEVAAFPDEGWSLVVLSNRDPPAATDLFRYVRALIASPEPGRCSGPSR